MTSSVHGRAIHPPRQVNASGGHEKGDCKVMMLLMPLLVSSQTVHASGKKGRGRATCSSHRRNPMNYSLFPYAPIRPTYTTRNEAKKKVFAFLEDVLLCDYIFCLQETKWTNGLLSPSLYPFLPPFSSRLKAHSRRITRFTILLLHTRHTHLPHTNLLPPT